MTTPNADDGGHFNGRAMGSALRLTVGRSVLEPAAGPGGVAAWVSVVSEFESSEAAMSRFRDTSELTRLNRSAGTGAVVRPSARLRRALVAADRAHRVTDGRFDPRVLVDLDRLGYRGAALETDPAGPAGKPGQDPRAAIDHRSIRPIIERVGRDGIRLERPVDLGGIGKGLALRWTAAELDRSGMKAYLLEAGGDLVARGLDPTGEPWLIGIEDPTEVRDHLAVIGAMDGAVATSSIRVHRWVADGRDVHHLVDPRTGEPATSGLLSVTVAGSDPAWAEVWSKVLFITGRAAIAHQARSRGMAAWWVAVDGTLEMTPDARRRTIWVASEDDPRT